MLVARRTRELALLRAIGASKSQITWSVIGEAFILGLIGGALGVLLGIGVAAGLRALLALLGIDLPAGDLVIAPRTIIVGLVAGLVATLFAAYFPARRASRVPPVAAMRDDVSLPARGLRVRGILGTVLTVLGVGLLGWAVSDPELTQRLGTAGLGAAAVLGGVIVLAPVFSRFVVGVVGAPVRAHGDRRSARRPQRPARPAAHGRHRHRDPHRPHAGDDDRRPGRLHDQVDRLDHRRRHQRRPDRLPRQASSRSRPRSATPSRRSPAWRRSRACARRRRSSMASQSFVTGVDPATIGQVVTLGVEPSALSSAGSCWTSKSAAAAGLSVGDTRRGRTGAISTQDLRLGRVVRGPRRLLRLCGLPGHDGRRPGCRSID